MAMKKQEEWEVLNEMVADGTVIIEQGEEGPEIILKEKVHEEFRATVAEFGYAEPELQAIVERLAEDDFEDNGKGTSLRKALIWGEVLMEQSTVSSSLGKWINRS